MQAKLDNHISQLNSEQRSALNSDGTTLLVACAGSGKTRTMVVRMLKLIVEGADPSRIMGLTFTNKAAVEMLERLSGDDYLGRKLEKGALDSPWLGTIHSFFYRILAEDLPRFDHHYAPRICVLDENKARILIEGVLKEMGIGEDSPDFVPPMYLSQIAAAQASGFMYEDEDTRNLFLGEDSTHQENLIYRVWGKYIDKKLQGDPKTHAKYVDFSDMITLTVKMFRANPNIVSKWASRFDHILVDEFQDTDMLQAEGIRFLASEHNNLFCVGDPRQCFPAGTVVTMENGSKKAIENIIVGDKVSAPLKGVGTLGVKVKHVHKSFTGKLLEITLKSGCKLRVTPSHLIPVQSMISGYSNPSSFYYVYIMKKGNFGWRVGMTKNIWSRHAGECPDSMKLVASFNTMEEALIYETYLSLSYCIPTNTYKRHGAETITEDKLFSLYGMLGSNHVDGMKRFFADFPHLLKIDNVPRTNNGANRRTDRSFDSEKIPVVYINLNENIRYHSTDVKSPRDRKYGGISSIMHEVILEYQGSRTRKATASYSEALKIARDLADEVGGFIQENVSLPQIIGHKKIFAIPASCLLPGFKLFRMIPLDIPYIPKKIPYHQVIKNTVVGDEILEITEIDEQQSVYDLELENVHLYCANDVIVHNCIYQFRGAVVDLTTNFTDFFIGGKVLGLNTNYRSRPEIVSHGNHLISNANFDVTDAVSYRSEEGSVTYLGHFGTDEDEAKEVIGSIQALLDVGTVGGDIAVLYRINAQSAPLEDALIKAGIPYVIKGSTGFYAREEVKDMIAYLHVIYDINTSYMDSDVRDAVNSLLVGKNGFETRYGSFERICNRPNRYLGKAFLTEWANQVRRGMNPLDALSGHYSKPYMERSARSFARDLMMLKTLLKEGGIGNFLRDARTMLGYDKWISKNFEDSCDNPKLDNLDTLCGRADDQGSVKSFLIYAASSAKPEESNGGTSKAVKLMTVHASKGLEFPMVFTVGLSDGLLPHWRSMDSGAVEEERRIAYVALTRAKDRAFLSGCASRGNRQNMVPSRFVGEMKLGI